MTAKLKAFDLFEKMKLKVYDSGVQSFDGTEMKDCAKQCALICVDEILKQLAELITPEYVSFWHGNKAGENIDGYELQEYWQQVKQEIINL